MALSEDQLREIARANIVDCSVEWLDLVEELEFDHDSDDVEGDAQKVYDLMMSAKITVEWDATPADD